MRRRREELSLAKSIALPFRSGIHVFAYVCQMFGAATSIDRHAYLISTLRSIMYVCSDTEARRRRATRHIRFTLHYIANFELRTPHYHYLFTLSERLSAATNGHFIRSVAP